MPAFKRFFQNHWPVILLSFISLMLFLANYVPDHFLLGWDNTVPELNLSLNLKRTLYGVWQEYRGLGTLDGMAHTANIGHWLYVGLLSLILPTHMIRYIFIILAHLCGGIGVYYLLKTEILPSLIKKTTASFQVLNLISLSSALLYQFNFMTIQMFYAPLELFVIHFAVLPWGVLTLIRYLRSKNVKDLSWFFLVNLLGVSQAHVPTIFIPYAAILGIFLLVKLLANFKKNWQAVALAGLILFASNAFWGLPYVYSTMNKSAEIVAAKQNRLGTSGTFYRNQAWTDLGSIATFGGFRLDYSDWNLTEEQFEPILKPWISFYKSPSFTLLSISITLLSLTGLLVLIYTTTKKKNSQHLPLILSWLFALTMLGTNIPLLKSFTTWLSANLPLFGQLFRFTFTKFSISYVFIISILVGVALSWLLKLKIQQYFVNSILVIFMGVVIYLAHPAFNGFFFYPALRIKLPKQYQQLTTYLNQDFNQSRVISFPIHSLWGWTTGTHNWGYRGSGFIWQALELPFIDRSFDPWSKYNETLFLQSNLALYRQDQAAFLKTFEKYHTDLIWYDNSIFHPGNYPENLFATEAHHFFDQTGQINLIQDELPLQLYQIDGSQPGRSIFAPPKAQVLDPDYAHEYTSFDQAYLSYGDYIFGKDYSLSFPFSYLQQEQVFTPQITNNHLIFTLSNLENQQLVIPNLANYQSQIMSVITGSVQNNQITLKIQTQLPYIANQTQEVYVQEINLPFETMSTFIIQFNQGKIEINPHELTADSQVITYLFATTDKNIEGKVINQKQDLVADFKLPIKDWLDSFDHQISQINNQDKIKINVPLGLNREFIFSDHPQRNESTHLNCSRPQQGTVQKSVLESGVTYLAQNKGIFCDTRYFSELKSEFQYLFHWQGEVLSGAGVRGFLLNPHTKRFDLDIGANKDSFNQWYGVYPSKNSYQAKGTQDYFGFILNGESYGKDKNQVSLQALEFYTLPLNWLTSIHTNNQNQLIFKTELIKTKKINTVLYQVKAKINSETGLIVLPQAYDQGWIAFKPFGKNFKHLKFNGWANAWEIPAGEHEIIIFYWPQLLVFGGYGVLIGTSIYLIIATAKKNKQHHKYSKIKHKTKHYLRGK